MDINEMRKGLIRRINDSFDMMEDELIEALKRGLKPEFVAHTFAHAIGTQIIKDSLNFVPFPLNEISEKYLEEIENSRSSMRDKENVKH